MTKIYHNPRCSKSRQTLALLEENGIEPEVVLYLETPPSVAQLEAICGGLGTAPLELCRTKEKRFKELGLSKDDERPDSEWLQILHDNPVLIERPVVVHDGAYAIGRPPENVLEII